MVKDDLDLIFLVGDYIYEGAGRRATCASTSAGLAKRWTTTDCGTRSIEPTPTYRPCIACARGS